MQEIDLTQGLKISAGQEGFDAALRAAVDYRGDITLTLADGRVIEGYLFNYLDGRLDIYPREGQSKLSVDAADVSELYVSGEDKAAARTRKHERLEQREK